MKRSNVPSSLLTTSRTLFVDFRESLRFRLKASPNRHYAPDIVFNWREQAISLKWFAAQAVALRFRKSKILGGF